MKHKDLVDDMAAGLNLPVDEVSLLDDTVSVLNQLIADGKTIGVQSFGSFEVKKKEERLSVHPVTKIKTLVPPKLAVAFKQSNLFKLKLKDIQHND
jgi:DNA-binding protein HU-beta